MKERRAMGMNRDQSVITDDSISNRNGSNYKDPNDKNIKAGDKPTGNASDKPSDKNDEERRKELADFLRTRRERLKPTPGKVTQLTRRRTPGLRREEVAEIAGVGATWYTWLEQARDIQPSADVLERVGKALELNPFEMSHLFMLAGRIAPVHEHLSLEEVPASLKRIIDDLKIPALVVGERLDHLYWNSKYIELVAPEWETLQAKGIRNWLQYIFLDASVRERLVDWESHSKRILAEFRASIGEQVGTPWVTELLEQLKNGSPEFVSSWKNHDVRERVSLTFDIQHPTLGRLSFERSVYSPVDAAKLKLFLFTPVKPTV
jgi:transcriptional regulator with XRE-family HTH domain